MIHAIGRLIVAVFLLAPATVVRGDGPVAVVRTFCQLDGRGDRLHPATWATVAPLVSWVVEPAWDRIFLISGYEIHHGGGDAAATRVEVRYTVTGTVGPGIVDDEPRIVTRRMELTAGSNGSWRLLGPPPPPSVFASQVDEGTMAHSLDPVTGDYRSSSALVWRELRRIRPDIPYRPLDELVDAPFLEPVEGEAAPESTPSPDTGPRPGDVVFYLDAGRPYHAGIVEESGVRSATLNAGERVLPLDAFPGERRLYRLREPGTESKDP